MEEENPLPGLELHPTYRCPPVPRCSFRFCGPVFHSVGAEPGRLGLRRAAAPPLTLHGVGSGEACVQVGDPGVSLWGWVCAALHRPRAPHHTEGAVGAALVVFPPRPSTRWGHWCSSASSLRLPSFLQAPTKNDRSTEGKAHREHREKLELVASFSFFGNVMSMASVQLAGAKRDALLLSFKDAKLSVVEYDPGTHDLKTLSLHYFEEPELRVGRLRPTPSDPLPPPPPCPRPPPCTQEGVRITLDCAQAAFISYDKMVISLKGGEIYVLTLITDGMRSVRAFHFDKAAASVLTSSMVTMEPGYLFLGSRLGNSLLLKYTEKLQEAPASAVREAADKEEPLSKKKRVDSTVGWSGGQSGPQDEVDEIEVYGSEAQSGTQLATYSFEVCDSILNIGPCANAAMGEPAFLSEEFQNSPEPDLEIVMCSGYGKNGALSVLQKSIRPQVVTTFELPGCYDMWTVVAPVRKEQEETPQGEGAEQEPSTPDTEDDGRRHGFLILSREDSTMILQTGQEIMELDTSGFATQGPTVFAGNIGDNRYIVQVSPLGIRLLEGVNQLHFIPVDLGSPIVQCAVADPYVVIMSSEGHVTMFLLKSDSYGGRHHRLALHKPPLHHQSKVIAMCVYRDVSGMFTTESRLGGARDELGGRSGSEAEGPGSETSPTVDDEEEMLYGDSGSLFSPCKEEARRSSQPPTDRDPTPFRAEPTHWCLLVRENGTMEIYQLPDWRLVFLVKNFPVGQRVLVDSSFGQPVALGSRQSRPYLLVHVDQELLIYEAFAHDSQLGQGNLKVRFKKVALGSRQSRPYLLVHVDQELLIYEAFAHDSQLGQGNLKVRFKKVPHNINFREKKPKLSKKKAEGGSAEEGAAARGRVARFRYFEDIYGYSGVFICGPSPHWLLVTSRGALRLHPMGIDGPIDSFAPFHNVNCPRGFLYFNRQGELRISVLPAYLSYDAPWPVRKIPLRCTAHYVAYHVESKVYAVATSTNTACTRIPRMTGEEKEFETIERDDRYIHPQQEAFSIQLISPVSWEAIPNARIELEEWEHVTCMKTVSLRSEETVSGLKGYVAAGTCLMQGEEVTCRGRILIMDVIEVVPEPGQPLTKNKFKVLYEKEQKGPVTALCHCNGHLVSAIGQKIFLWSLRASELTGMAFIDTQLYIHQMISIKNFILAADVMKSISLLRYQEDSKTLSLVSRDAKPLEVYSVDFMVDSTQLGFLVSDRDRNLMVYMYLPEAKESFGGMRLLRRADFHVGAHVNTFWRTPCRGAAEGPSKKSVMWENKHITWFATLDGGIGLLLPMQEKTYRRLLMLQNALTTMLPHHAGLNPRAFRMLHVDRRTLQNAVRNILDGELLNRYLYLSTMERSELAKKIGTTPDIILDDLLETDRVTAHF
ncbi:PREDICTED: cleavage and polyadenylation specificity factor subunit 1 [Myotis brandtii]|uniref:cleavage and polyadenylation specificity factor subunit 1 n=1 Tax=Myotis brandtii TaxID=109478 RepID=UPI000704429F|nr:PREDICTED: cleavage and polyadenylation specificity factor subunit 1 [Myotis brandtii]